MKNHYEVREIKNTPRPYVIMRIFETYAVIVATYKNKKDATKRLYRLNKYRNIS